MLKRQDIVVALKLVALEGRPWTYQSLANELFLSASQVYNGFKGAAASRLIDPDKRVPLRQPICEFLLHGLQYVFPERPGELTRGIPTSYAAPPLSDKIQFRDQERLVWPYAEGDVSGQAFSPLYKSAPKAAEKDPALYELLSLVDALRGGGKARERRLARELLEDRIKAYNASATVTSE